MTPALSILCWFYLSVVAFLFAWVIVVWAVVGWKPMVVTTGSMQPAINPGPFQFHGDPSHVRRWMAARGFYLCRKSEIREIMRPVMLPAPEDAPDAVRYGLCDGIHHDDHEFVPA